MSLKKKGGNDWIVKSVNTPVVKSEMIPFKTHAKEQGIDMNEVELFCKEKGISIDNFYFLSEHPFSPYAYWDKLAFQGFPSLTQGFLSWEGMANALVERIQKSKKYVQEKDFDKLMLVTETIGQHLVFQTVYNDIPKEKRYKLFMDMYVLNDYGFSTFSPEIVEDAIANQSKEEREQAITKLREDIGDVENEIVVYRGMGDESTPVEKAMSWTTSEEIAYFFANRLGKAGKVVKGTVNLEHVIDYITRRSEKEVIILPGYVNIVEQEEMVTSEDEINSLNQSGVIQEFQTMRDYFIKPEYYLSPYGVHGVGHVRRVLLHCVSLANAIGLESHERGILMLSACYHDIGRKHDDTCEEHGQWSLEKAEELSLDEFYILSDGDGGVYPEHLTREEMEVVEFLVRYHCQSDEKAEKAMEVIEDDYVKELVAKLYPIFKDADALDRVRIRDLNMDFLRTKEARQRVKFAEDVLLFVN